LTNYSREGMAIRPRQQHYLPSAERTVFEQPLQTVQHTKGTTMAATNINRVVITGNLTADPELRSPRA
jgi:hypothetical protein